MPPELAMNVLPAATLAGYTQPALIVPRLHERDTAGIISELSQVLQRQGTLPDVLPFYQAALNHELLDNSALECGIAFPHARLSGVRHVQFAFGRCLEPVAWGTRGSSPVQLVFLLAVPATDATGYLHLLASLARLGHQPELLRELRIAPDSNSILAVLETIRLRQA